MSKKDRANWLLCPHGHGDGTPAGAYCQCPRDCACRYGGHPYGPYGCPKLKKGEAPPVPPLFVPCERCGGTGQVRTRFSRP